MKILEIKALIASEVSQILALDRICLGGFWTAAGYLREIDSPNSTLLTLNLQNNGSQPAIGMACLWSIAQEAHITLLAIHPDYRSSGLGQLLLLSLLKDAIARQLKWATLEVNVNNFGAINLYKKFGFQVAGTRKNYYQSTGEDALVLWLKGIQQPEFKLSLSGWQKNLSAKLRNNGYICRQS